MVEYEIDFIFCDFLRANLADLPFLPAVLNHTQKHIRKFIRVMENKYITLYLMTNFYNQTSDTIMESQGFIK